MPIRIVSLSLLCAVSIIYIFAYIDTGHGQMRQKQEELRNLKEEHERLNNSLNQITRENEQLRKGDPYMMMRIARETYGFCFPGEKIYHFND